MKTISKRFKKALSWLKYHILDIIIVCSLIVLNFAYPNVLIWVDLVIGVLVLIFVIWQLFTKWSFYGKVRKSSVHFFGHKGTGKDMTIQSYISYRFKHKYLRILKRKKLKNEKDINAYFHKHPLYLSTINYGFGCRIVSIDEFTLFNKKSGKVLTYQDFIDNVPIRCKKFPLYEGLDLILPEAQLYLPNTEFNTLDKKYPWLPVFIALSRHLYNMNILINSQEYIRPWVKIRGQQDFYVRALCTYGSGRFMRLISPYLPFFRSHLIVKVRTFEEQKSAENNMLPFEGKGAINEISKNAYISSGQATKEVYEASNGVIRDVYLLVKKKDIVYDSRYFHKVIFGSKAPTN